MVIEIRMRITCSGGHCRSAKQIEPEVYEGWLKVKVTENGFLPYQEDYLPQGWVHRSLEGSGELEPLCPTCKTYYMPWLSESS